MSLLKCTDSGAIRVLIFDHGKANEIGSELLRELEAFSADLDDGEARALISTSHKVSSRGTPIFVAGADVTERVGWDHTQVLTHVAWQRQVLRGLRDAPVFHVCVAHGVAYGWGTEFLLTADYRIATPEARFALPETGLGIVPGAGGTGWLADEIGPAHALRLGMTGEVISADEALRIGLVQEIAVDQPAALARAQELASKAATRSPTAAVAFKTVVRGRGGRTEGQKVSAEQEAYARCVHSGDAAIGREHFDAIRAGTTPPWSPRRT